VDISKLTHLIVQILRENQFLIPNQK